MYYVSRVKAKAFKNIGSEWRDVLLKGGLNAVVGPNGCGKSNLLDAICFAFAIPASTFGVGRLADLQNLDCSEVCEVHVEISKLSALKQHTIVANLTTDGTRKYKVDHKQRTGKEVKVFLQSKGISLDSSGAVIKQAQVTNLADVNSAAQLASIIAAASGLGRWNQERQAAADELVHTSHAAAGVMEKLNTLELTMDRDRTALVELRQCEALDTKIEEANRSLKQKCLDGFAQCERRLVDSNQHANLLKEEKNGMQQALQNLEQQLEALGKQLTDAGAAEDSHFSCTTMQHAVTAEEIQVLEQRLQTASAIQNSLQEKQEAALQTSALLAQLSTAIPTAMMGENTSTTLPAGFDAKACENLLISLEHDEKELERYLSATSSHDDPRVIAAKLQQQSQMLSSASQELDKLQRDLQTYLLQLAPTCNSSARPLHSCFEFMDISMCQELEIALEVVAGRFLNVYVADDIRQASESLGVLGKGQRIWALDCLQLADNRDRFKRAAACYEAGDVIIPTELLQYDIKYKAAIFRAFGGCVIAKSSQVAATLMERHGIPSVTLQGDVSKRGTLQGGWKPERRTEGNIAIKLRCDSLTRSICQVEETVKPLHANIKELQEKNAASLEVLGSREEAQLKLREVHKGIRKCRAELKAQEVVEQMGMSLPEMQAQLARLQQQMKDDDEEVRELQTKMCRCDMEGIVNDLSVKRRDLQHLQQRVQDAQVREASNQASLVTLKEQERDVQQQIHTGRIALLAKTEQLAAQKHQQQCISDIKSQFTSLISQYRLDVADAGRTCITETHEELQPGDDVLSTLAADCTKLGRLIKKLQAEKALLRPSKTSSLADEHARARQDAHKAHRQQLDMLKKATDSLQDYMAGFNGTVVETNDVVATRIAALFCSLMSEILPKYSFRVDFVGDHAHEGVVLRYTQPGQTETWMSSLDSLSGGQRTLISLAFILASNLAGSRCSVLLMDEVDAALDEANQNLVGRLIQHVLSRQESCCTQVVCVSHNPALQDLCSHVVSLRPLSSASKRAKQ